MIRPTKYTDLNLSILNVASFIIKEFKSEPSLVYNELLDKIIGVLGEKSRFVFIDALSFLYCTGLIEYNLENDAVYYLKNGEVINNEIK